MDKDIEEQEPEEEQDQSQKQGLDSKAIDYINRARRANEDVRQNKSPKDIRGRLANQTRNRLEQAGKKTAGKIGKRVAQQVGRKAAVAAGQTLIETAPVWGIPALIILIIIIVIIVIFGGSQSVNGGELPPLACADVSGTCSSSPTCADVPNSQPDNTSTCNTDATKPTCCAPASVLDCSPANAAASLKNNLNVVVTGATDNTQVSEVCKILAKATVSPLYKQLLTCGGNQLTIALISTGSISLGGPNLIQLNNFFKYNSNDGSRTNLLIHESGHVIYRRNCSRISQRYDNTYKSLVSSDGVCYDIGYVRSYALRLGTYTCNPGTVTGISSSNESFAEQIADYVTYKYFTNPTGFRCSKSLQGVFASVCKNTYSWVNSNIFGGIMF